MAINQVSMWIIEHKRNYKSKEDLAKYEQQNREYQIMIEHIAAAILDY